MTLKDWMDTWPLPECEPFPGEAIRADGWVYRDLPRMSPEAFDLFTQIVGDENMRWLTFADYGKSKRGQVFISPAGIDRMRAHVKESPEG